MKTRLRPYQPEDIHYLQQWVTTVAMSKQWGGPSMPLPCQHQDLQAEDKPSFILEADGVVSGFGQFYSRLQHVHLGRLIIAPHARGAGLATVLVNGLLEYGRRSLGHDRASLFVMPHNQRAMGIYQRLGFIVSTYPGQDVSHDFIYMTKGYN